MEKPLAETQQLPAQLAPSTIQRKPLPSNTTAPTTIAASGVTASSDPEKGRLPAYISITETTLPSQPDAQLHTNLALFSHLTPSESYQQDQKRILHNRVSLNGQLPPLPQNRSTAIQRLRTKWLFLRKRTRYLIIGTTVAILILIIGLAAGLSTRPKRFTNLPLPNSHGGPYSGDLTYYDPDLGACGIKSTSKEFIVAVSHYLYDAVQVGTDPNSNPLCGKKIRANRAGKSVDLTVVDRCTGCQPKDIDVTRTVFEGLADIDQGRVPVTWAWLEDVPRSATSSS